MAAKTQTQNLSLSNLGDMQILANDIKKFIQENNLSTNVQGKDFPQAEAWQYAGNRLGIIPQGGYIKNISSDTEIKYEASVVLVDINNDFKVVGQGFAVCSNKENGKKYYQEFAICSMAQTRAIGKSFRIMLSFLMRLAGYEPTPAEEMDYNGTPEVKPVNQAEPKPATPKTAQAPKVSAETSTKIAADQAPGVESQEAANAEIPQVDYATAKQKEEIIRLLNNVCITRQEKTKMLLNINKLTSERATKSIQKLRKVIEDRETEANKEAQNTPEMKARNEAAVELHELATRNSEILGEAKVKELYQLCNTATLEVLKTTKEEVTAWLAEQDAAAA